MSFAERALHNFAIMGFLAVQTKEPTADFSGLLGEVHANHRADLPRVRPGLPPRNMRRLPGLVRGRLSAT